MGLFPNIQEEAKAKGIDLALKYIPAKYLTNGRLKKTRWCFMMCRSSR